jgi:cellulose synthase/poly-beta-1,6-N-acetylglucosamine synthase-like glycosyltransferase
MFETLLLVLYYGAVTVLVILAVYRLLLTRVYLRRGEEAPATQPQVWPRVTVQLPMYNERWVAERLIRSVAAIDYPSDRMQIQVLDDSTDETRDLVAGVVAELRATGLDIEHVHRIDRTGYKAGALEAGLASATGELIAVFDADFLPEPSFLRQCVGYFDDDRVGMVQARWEHLNRSFSLLTRAQAVLLDGHFVVEQTARARNGRFLNFNGTAGIWRRTTIDDAGGWSHDTLTEDLDLSYRAQLRGWTFRYVTHVSAPAEIPPDIAGFKSQQHRWAKGSIECLQKLAPAVARAERPWLVRAEGLLHLGANLGYLCLLLVVVLLPLVAVVRRDEPRPLASAADLLLLLSGLLSVIAFYWVSLRRTAQPAWQRIPTILLAMGVDIGMALHKSRAVAEALVGWRTDFVRTPKHALVATSRSLLASPYVRVRFRDGLPELVLALWSLLGMIAVAADPWPSLTALAFMAVFVVSFGYIGSLALLHATWRRRAA